MTSINCFNKCPVAATLILYYFFTYLYFIETIPYISVQGLLHIPAFLISSHILVSLVSLPFYILGVYQHISILGTILPFSSLGTTSAIPILERLGRISLHQGLLHILAFLYFRDLSLISISQYQGLSYLSLYFRDNPGCLSIFGTAVDIIYLGLLLILYIWDCC